MKDIILALAIIIVLTSTIGFWTSCLAAMGVWVAFELVKKGYDIIR